MTMKMPEGYYDESCGIAPRGYWESKQPDIREINRTILDVSFKYKLSHLSSCLTAAPIILEIYQQKRDEDFFILSNGHAGLGLYAVLESIYQTPSAEQIYLDHDIHPERCTTCRLDCSTGSLGQGLPIGLGLALADPKKDVYCLISDGEAMEGSIWEALRIKNEQGLSNLKVHANLNGYSAYRKVNRVGLANKLSMFDPLITIHFTQNPDLEWLKGVNGHYSVMNQQQYEEALKKLT